jgi:hypothetical protein
MGSGRHGAEVAHDPSNGPPRTGGNESVIELETALPLCRQVQDEVVGSCAWRLVEVRGLPPMLLLRAERRVATAPALAGQIEEQPLTGVGS